MDQIQELLQIEANAPVKMWQPEYLRIIGKLKNKIDYLNKKEREIDITKVKKSFIDRLNQEKELVTDLLKFLQLTEMTLKRISDSNTHLSFQNTRYFHLMNSYESEFKKEYERSLKTITGERK